MTYPLTAILSDLHGNVPALETALEDAFARGVRRLVCLGDVVGYGARPRECLERVMELCVPEPHPRTGPWSENANGNGNGHGLVGGLCLQGNHEHALLGSAEDFNPKARAAIEWTRDELGRGVDREHSYELWDFVGALRPSASDGTAMFAHGSPRDPVREYMLPRDIQDERKMRANFACMDAPVCFVGHSHVPCVYFEDGRIFRPRGTVGPYDLGDLGDPETLAANRAIVNVGSVGQPRDGDPRLSYVVYDGRNLTFVRLEYDRATAMDEIRAVPELPDYLADRLAVGR